MRVHSQQTHKSDLITILFKSTLPIASRLVIGPGAIEDVGRLLSQCAIGERVAVLSQPSVRDKFAEPLVEQLGKDRQCRLIELPDGEACKSSDSLLAVWGFLQEMALQRNDCLVAVGGGALTDVAGFAASTYLRGIPLVLIPTTVLGQVDAAIGGKTGINLPAGKNLAGSFYFPTAVIVDPEVLSTLSEREVRSGLGEIVKYALIEKTLTAESEYRAGPQSLLSLMEACLVAEPFAVGSSSALGIITACVKMKLAVVAKDPHEQRLRRTLNLGHTLAHAVEKVSQYKVSHGEAVAIGCVFACRLAEKLNKFPAQETARLISLLKQAGLPCEIPDELSGESLFKAMAFDKKRQGQSIRFVLPSGALGSVDFEAKVELSDLQKALG